MAMCIINSMRKNGSRTVYIPWSWNGTRMSRTSDQGMKCEVFRLDIRLAPLPFPLHVVSFRYVECSNGRETMFFKPI